MSDARNPAADAATALARRFNLCGRGSLAVMAAFTRADVEYSTAPAELLATQMTDWLIHERLLPPAVAAFDFREAVRLLMIDQRKASAI